MIFNPTYKAAIVAAGTALGIVMLQSSTQAATLTQWNFNTPDSNAATGTETPNIGIGTINRGNTTGTFVTADEDNSASTDTAVRGKDSGLETTGYPAATVPDTTGVRFNVSTLGHQNVIVGFDQYFSETSSRYSRFQYSVNGADFLNFGSLVEGRVNSWSNSNLFDLSNIAGVNDNANFAFRIVSAFAPDTTGYAGTGGIYATDGIWRFDMTTVTAESIPPQPIPTPAMLPGLVGLSLGVLRQRKSVAA